MVATPLNDSASFVFTAPTGASSVNLMIKKSTDSTYTDSGVVLTSSSTSATISSLLDATSYNAKLVVVGGEHEGESNVVTFTTL